MEIGSVIWRLRKLLRKGAAVILLILFSHGDTAAQQVYTVKNGKMYIELGKNLPDSVLNMFIDHYDLEDLGLKYFIKTNLEDTLKLRGWHVDRNNDKLFAISKALVSSEDLTNVAAKIIFAEQPSVDLLFPPINNGIIYGFNKFSNNAGVSSNDSVVTFILRNNANAKRVNLAGSFNQWNPDTLPMIKTDSGWIATVKLGPGKYWYKFIADGNWMLDENNSQRENDGHGNTNSVFYKTNYVFKLNSYANARKVYLAGSFNRWRPKEALMNQTPTGWELPVYLAEGTHTYKFIVDGDWKTDPGNPNALPNEFNDFNSVISLGNPYLFKLNGYDKAKKVLVTGTFNGWRKDELFMKKTDSTWILPYVLGAGNYEYRFIVDGKEIIDPANPLLTGTNKKTANSFLILEPNYTFRLKGYGGAKEVFLAGDFNNYSGNSLAMKHVGDEWVFSVHLTRGKHIYKFVVDGQWIRDPQNKLWEQNKFGTGDSVLWFNENE